MMKPAQIWEVIRAKERELATLNTRHEKLLRQRQQREIREQRQIGINQRRNLELAAAIWALKEVAGKPPGKTAKKAKLNSTEHGALK